MPKVLLKLQFDTLKYAICQSYIYTSNWASNNLLFNELSMWLDWFLTRLDKTSMPSVDYLPTYLPIVMLSTIVMHVKVEGMVCLTWKLESW
jgi:hypothetical protein